MPVVQSITYGGSITPWRSNRVLIHVDTELAARDLLNSRMAYVSVSRGALDPQLFTNDREKLPTALGHDISKQSAKCRRSTRRSRKSLRHHNKSTAWLLVSAFKNPRLPRIMAA